MNQATPTMMFTDPPAPDKATMTGRASIRSRLFIAFGLMLALLLAVQALLRARVAEQAMVANNLDAAPIARHKQAWTSALADTAGHLEQLREQLADVQQADAVDPIVARIEAYRATYERYYKDLIGYRFPDTKERPQADALRRPPPRGG